MNKWKNVNSNFSNVDGISQNNIANSIVSTTDKIYGVNPRMLIRESIAMPVDVPVHVRLRNDLFRRFRMMV